MRLTAGVATGMGVFYALELAEHPELFGGEYAVMLALNVAAPLALLLPAVQRRRGGQVMICLGLLFGMWLERVQIIVSRSESLWRVDYMPSLSR